MRGAARPPLVRILAIDRAVRAGAWPNARTLAQEFEVHARTIARDIAFLRDQLGAPIEFDPVRNGYFYSDPSFVLPYIQLTEGELVAVFLAERVLQDWQGTPFAPDLERAFRKIVAALGDSVTIDLGELSGTFSVRTTSEAAFDPAIFRDLVAATRQRRRVKLDYYSASRDTRSDRLVDPYHLASVDGHWYLIAKCHLRNDVRMFAPSRIRALELTEERFEPPDFVIEDYLADSLGVIRGASGERHRVRLRFTGEAVRYVRERTWHASQAMEEQADGTLILNFELSHLREIERWALSWGADCEVLEPPELRQRVVEIHRQALGTHENRPMPTEPPESGSRPSRSSRRRRHGHN